MNEISTRRHQIETGGASIAVSVLHVRGTKPGPTLALLSGVHGDEWEGVVAAGRICRLMHERALKGQMRIVSICNEPAFGAIGRCSPIDGKDLARCFPGDRRGSISDQLAALLTDEVIRPSDFLIDLHSAGLHYTMPTLVGFIDGENAAARQSAEAAARFGAPVIWRHPPPPPPGRTISAACTFGIPSMYLETTGAGELRERDVDCFTSGVQNVLRHLSMLDGDAPPPQPALRLAGSGDLDSATVRARRGGILIRSAELLQQLEVGDVVGTIVDSGGEVVETLAAGHRGTVVMLRHTPRIAPGDRICHLADRDEEGGS